MEKGEVTFEFTDQVIPTGEHLKIFGGVGFLERSRQRVDLYR